jgi:hypothetical protein
MIPAKNELIGNCQFHSFSYVAYGLSIQSTFPIPEFLGGDNACDVTIEVRSDFNVNDFVPSNVAKQPLALQVNREKAIVYLQNAGVFVIQGGSQIIIIPVEGISLDRLRRCLIGTVMAVVLYQRGQLVLHASAVNIGDAAAAFVGRSGAGKSSWAGVLHAQGHTLMTDDVAAICLDSRPAKLSPAFPQIKLSSAVADMLGYGQQSQLQPSLAKRGHHRIENFCKMPRPIHRIYVLDSGPDLMIEPLASPQALMELMRHSTLAPYCEGDEAHRFLQCAALLKVCSVYRLQRPHSLNLLPHLARLMVKHFTSEDPIARV